jgi:hypothetical protein
MSFTVLNSYGPFPDPNTFQYCSVRYLELPDIAQATRVCKCWNQLFSDQDLWKALFEKEGIPLVISANGTARNYKQDFKTLYPITISGKTISRFLGKVTEKIPPITEKRFNELQEPDPFELGKIKRETFMFIVDPSFIMRTIDNETPLTLDDQGNLMESIKGSKQNSETNTTGKSELKIPLSLKNIKTLSSYPLERRYDMPVFDPEFNGEVFKQCNTYPDKTSVYFMRRHVVIDQSRKKSYDEQKRLTEDKGFDVTPLRIRVLFDAVSILKNGSCPDSKNLELIYSRHSESVQHGTYGSLLTFVGGFTSFGQGLRVFSSYSANGYTGTAPGGPAEVPSINS